MPALSNAVLAAERASPQQKWQDLLGRFIEVIVDAKETTLQYRPELSYWPSN